ncbi:MAG: LPS export ABC transporter permease LptF [Prolixibacteraceae bacterium]|nr:LPS export ABC transporter permease LptF [Burkholderiales bacterium]
MSIFQRSLTREFSTISASIAGVLVGIIIVQQLVILLRRAAIGLVEPEAVLALMGFQLIAYLPLLLALALFVGILLTLSRGYRDSEMPVWFSSGLSIAAWIRPVLAFGLPIVLLTALLSLFLTPWAVTQSVEYQRVLRSRDDVSRLSPGSFIESRGSNSVFFVDKTFDSDELVRNVFVQYNQNGRSGVVVAEKGYQQLDPNGDRFLVLQNGRQYEGTPGALDFRIVDFEKQRRLIVAKELKTDAPSTRAISTMGLLEQPTPERIAELHWRLALPVAATVLALLAIPLSFANPRSGSSWNLFIGVLIFFLYYNLLKIFEAWTAQGDIPTWLGMWPVHLVMLATLGVLFARQLLDFSILRHRTS